MNSLVLGRGMCGFETLSLVHNEGKIRGKKSGEE